MIIEVIDLVKLTRIYGVGFLKSVVKPFEDAERRVDIENFKLLLRSLEIGFHTQEINEFKYYCAN